MRPVTIGIIGCGVIGQRHLLAAKQSPFIKIAAIVDKNEQLARNLATEFGIETVYTDANSLFDDPGIEGVVLATPTAGRTELALRAFYKGKHVLVEKPVAMNANEVRKMIKARGSLIAGCSSSRFRFLESADVAGDLISSGVLGALRLIRCRIIKAVGKPPEDSPPPWRLSKGLNGGGILVNWGCYDLDYLLGITGWSLKPKLVLAQTWGVSPRFINHVAPGSDAEAHYTAFIQCEDGIGISLERGEYVAAKPEEIWQVIGAHGSLQLNMLDQNQKTMIHDDTTPGEGLISKVVWQGDETTSAINAGPIRDFAKAIRENHPPKTSLEQAMLIQKITDAIYLSANRGRAVKIRG